MIPFEQIESEFSAAAALQASMSSSWFGALGAAALGAAFAAGTSILAGMPLTRVAALRDESVGAKRDALSRYLTDPTRVLSRWLVGRIACTALTAVLIGRAIYFISPAWAVPVAVLGTLATYGFLTEITTTLARRNPTRSTPFLLRLLRPAELLTFPIAWPLEAVARISGRLVPASASPDPRVTEAEMNLLVEEGQKAGTLREDHARMLQNVLEFTEITASDLMVPRTSIVAIPAKTTINEVLQIVRDQGHSRYPVFRDSIDNIVGLLYAKDLFRVLDEASGDMRKAKVEGFLRTPVNFVPEAQPVSALLREMRARRLHMAVVVDDYGGVSGVVTLEDIIEQIIGDIQDEHDFEEDPVVDLGDGRLLVDAAVAVGDISEALGVELPEDGDFVSLGGLLIHHAGHVPKPGAQIEAFGLKFIVREADERRVSKVEIQPLEPASGEVQSVRNERKSPLPYTS